MSPLLLDFPVTPQVKRKAVLPPGRRAAGPGPTASGTAHYGFGLPGRVKVKMLPPPGLFSAQMLPP